jgi:hypothetical protein
MHNAKQLAEKILNLSRLLNSEMGVAAVFCALDSTCLWRSGFSLARQHLEQAGFGDAIVGSGEMDFWMIGYSGQAQSVPPWRSAKTRFLNLIDKSRANQGLNTRAMAEWEPVARSRGETPTRMWLWLCATTV